MARRAPSSAPNKTRGRKCPSCGKRQVFSTERVLDRLRVKFDRCRNPRCRFNTYPEAREALEESIREARNQLAPTAMDGGRTVIAAPPHSLNSLLAHVRNGGKLGIYTYTGATEIDARCLARFEAAGEWLLREDGNGYRIHRGRHSDYLLPGQLKVI